MGFSMKRQEFKTVIWSSFLLLLSWSCASEQSSCPTGTTRPVLLTPNPSVSQLTVNSGFMSPIVNSFLGSVQPNPFPKDLLVRVVKTKVVNTQDTIKEILNYEIGFLVCLAIGILYIILMPLIGLFFACCRCCGNCGGRMYQKQTNNINCKRKYLYCSTFFITSLILAGNICMFLSSTYTADVVQNSPKEITDILENVQDYLDTIPKQINQVVNESTATIDKVQNNLKDTGPQLGKLIQNDLKGPLNPALNSITEVAQVINSTGVALLQFNRTLEKLKPRMDNLKFNLLEVQKRINATLQKPECQNCTSVQPAVDKLSVNANLDFSDQNDLQSAVNKAENADVIGQANKGKNYFDQIPKNVETATKDFVQVALKELQSLKDQMSGLTKDLPVDTLKNITSPLTDTLMKSIEEYSPQIEQSSTISRAVGVILSCVILLVVVCNFLGLLLGAIGLKPKDDPTKRSCTSNCGGTFFMIGVGFSFLVSWIFMIVVLILFLVGGHTYTLICKPWQNRELIQVIDTPDLIPGFDLSKALNLKTNLTIGNIYSDCQMNKPLWTTLHLNELIDLNSVLNVSQYTGEIYQIFEDVQINIADITILTPDIKSQLEDFSNSSSIMNFSRITQEINTVSEINLTSAAEDLDVLASYPVNSNISSELKNEAEDIRNIQTEINDIMPLLLELNSNIKNLSVIASQINTSVKKVLKNAHIAQDVLNFNISQIVKNGSRVFIDCQLELFKAFVNWANQTITERVGRCGPAAAAIDRSEELVCKHFVAALNAFWFSLGWCMLFLIPSIIFSVKLAKYYRTMKSSDVIENNTIMLHNFPRASLKPFPVGNGKSQQAFPNGYT